ncbi:spore cortex biosynthesis protein YabQ [Mesobacillus subterraneus]|uniref:spore cortex biosynthesis protein YabQ n=1 Tax=Mesobacillus subterraneus TaxID=285983 RepID=UPI00203D0209|nr:spore cortex biosynthesis protein YabQ [Mesobacillus subterraneus]MCM3667096.1 spore cortex biosynthesis protein YabQ [Mesobacillus subterraneus]MCM3685886.1 spore cortex biosynthesis protein YabQ [Mesobacillus subterraneus]
MTLSTQFLTMLAMIGMGSLFGASLDTHNRFLKRSKRKSWIVFINDIMFWLVQGLSVFYVLFSVNMGELRFYIFIALLCGFAAYQSLFKKIYLKILERAITITINVYIFFVKAVRMLVVRPLLFLAATVLSLLLMTGRGLYSLVKWLLAVLLWLLKNLLWKPVKMILLLFWKLLPKKVKKSVEKLYNKLAGILNIVKNYSSIPIKWIKNFKK